MLFQLDPIPDPFQNNPPDRKTDSTKYNKRGRHQIHPDICHVRGKAVRTDKIHTRIAERRDRMKNTYPDTMNAKVHDESRHDEDCSARFNYERPGENSLRHLNDPAHRFQIIRCLKQKAFL